MRISFGAKLALVCIICLSVVAAVAAGFNVLQVRMLKGQMLRGSERLAEEKARSLAEELVALEHQMVPEGQDASRQREAMRQRIQLFIERNNEVLFATLIQVGDDGIESVLVSDFKDPEMRSQLMEGDSFRAELQEGDEEALKVVLERQDGDMPMYLAPLEGSGTSGLHLALAVRDSEIYRELETAGREITMRVALMTALLAGALILAFAGVWMLFNGQERLIRENEQLNKMAYIGTLASGLAHEIRNPLNAMSVNLGVVQEDLEDPREDSEPRVRQIVGRLMGEVEQLNQTLVNFLAFAIPREAGRQRVRPAAIVREVAEALEADAQARGVQIEMDLDEALEIQGDPGGLRQVIHNLALNALEAMTGAQRRLAFRAWRENSQARLMVSDTGEGIASADLERIFEPFHTAKARGTGFGLPIARRIVRDHGGRIWAQSQPGKGASFHLEFPLPSPRGRA